MIALASDVLIFRMSNGQSVPLSAEMISIELLGNTMELFDAEFVRHAAGAVFHYFKHDLRMQSVTVAEFASALEKVLRGFVLSTQRFSSQEKPIQGPVVVSDLRQLASESGKGCELFFFPRLREEVRAHVRKSPSVVQFRGLRSCVKQLAGAQRWSSRCRTLRDQIIAFLRECLTAECRESDIALVIR
jgi:hypothetical protein